MHMKVVTLIPFWLNYKYLDGSLVDRSLVNIGGRTLISRTIRMANFVNSIEETFVFSSNDEIVKYIDDECRYIFLERGKFLDSDMASIEVIIENFLQKIDAEIVVLIHPKSPFIKPQTIQDCIEKVTTGEFDSAFLASSIQKYAWFKGERLNYSSDFDTPFLSDLNPILVETSSVYVFTRKMFDKHRKRIGLRPYIKKIGHFEGFEVERKDDLEVAELIVNTGLDKEIN